MASVQVFESFEKLKADRVARPLIKEEKVRQRKATNSLKKLQKIEPSLM